MLEVIMIMVAGIAVGYVGRSYKKLIQVSESFVSYLIYLLLFVLGLGVGMNQTVMKNLDSIGLIGVIISVASILGSLLLSWLVYHFFFRKTLTKSADEE